MVGFARGWIVSASVGLLGLAVASGCDSMRSTRRTDPAAGLDALRTTERFPGPPEAVDVACREAMADLGIVDDAAQPRRRWFTARTRGKADPNVQQASGETGPRTLHGKTSDGRPVLIDLKPSGAVTAVSVRVGRDGDVSYAHTLLERVGIRMGIKPPSAIDDPPSPPPATAAYPIFSRESREAVPNSTMLRDHSRSSYQDSPVPY